jgi:Xaa-Pro aminopeptidase
MTQPLERLRASLRQRGLERALLSHPESLGWLARFDPMVEEWPVANPFVAWPALLVVEPQAATLVVASFHAAHAAASPFPAVPYRSYDYERQPDPAGELEQTLASVLGAPGRIAIEAGSLPLAPADALRARGFELVPSDELVLAARRIKGPDEIEAIRRASRLADVVQQAIKDEAAPGRSEAELAALAQAAIAGEVGRRVPAIVTVTTGVATATGGGEATDRRVQPGDLVLTDTSPWIDGAWSDTANAVLVGTPDSETRRVFDDVRRALELAIDLCRPGAVPRDIDRRVREALAHHGPTYPHHTGHGIGAAWSEQPRITPYETMPLEEGMVLAVEPAVYREGWGGIRLEHVFVVRAGGNEVLTRFEHTL